MPGWFRQLCQIVESDNGSAWQFERQRLVELEPEKMAQYRFEWRDSREVVPELQSRLGWKTSNQMLASGEMSEAAYKLASGEMSEAAYKFLLHWQWHRVRKLHRAGVPSAILYMVHIEKQYRNLGHFASALAEHRFLFLNERRQIVELGMAALSRYAKAHVRDRAAQRALMEPADKATRFDFNHLAILKWWLDDREQEEVINIQLNGGSPYQELLAYDLKRRH